MKGLIIAEMAGLWLTGALLDQSAGAAAAASGDSSTGARFLLSFVGKRGLLRTAAIVALLAGLLLVADAGFGGTAALFGAVVLLAYWLDKSGVLGERLNIITGRLNA